MMIEDRQAVKTGAENFPCESLCGAIDHTQTSLHTAVGIVAILAAAVAMEILCSPLAIPLWTLAATTLTSRILIDINDRMEYFNIEEEKRWIEEMYEQYQHYILPALAAIVLAAIAFPLLSATSAGAAGVANSFYVVETPAPLQQPYKLETRSD